MTEELEPSGTDDECEWRLVSMLADRFITFRVSRRP